jgi:hypothetical protein
MPVEFAVEMDQLARDVMVSWVPILWTIFAASVEEMDLLVLVVMAYQILV